MTLPSPRYPESRMTIDERLEKLAERHDALTRTVESIAAMLRNLTRDLVNLSAAARQDGNNIRALARIAEIHERRLTDPEGGE